MKQVKVIKLSAEESKTIHELTHMQLFAHLVKAGPHMHGTPGAPKGKGSH
jgi:hypothetical protein